MSALSTTSSNPVKEAHTWPIEIRPRRHIKHHPTNRQQYPLVLHSIKRLQRLGGIRLEQNGGRVGFRHPCVVRLELGRYFGGYLL